MKNTASNDLLVVFVTTPDRTSAETIAQVLIEERLAACVNIVPELHSVFRWEGKLERSNESMLFIKTTSAALQKLEAKVREIHPYSTPEFVALRAEYVEEQYLKWARGVLEN